MSSRKERVRGFISAMFISQTDAPLSDDDSLLQLQVVDSTGFLELVGFIETQFGVKVNDNEMVPENLDTLNCIEQFLVIKLGPES
jgi:acyl carrier protein